MSENLTKEQFSANLNTKFRVQPDAADLEIELREVNEGIATPRNEQFALVFVGPQEPFLQQAIYHLIHDKLGEFDLFLVPIGKEPGGFQYEAVFNRFLGETQSV
ncbi:MAG: hypothetical protein QOJ64_3356 [Acidobacteriota bacterium]|jgi:hypothetical protein|nr:hypothetical protein [Acidobacteriota bacterium]